MPVERERDAIGLHDVERLEVLPRRDVVVAIVKRRVGSRRTRLVDHVQHAVLDQVDDRHHVLDRPAISIRFLRVAQVGDRLERAVIVLPGGAKVSARPGVDLDQLDLLVGEAARPHCRQPARVRANRLHRAAKFFRQRKRVLSVQRCPTGDRLRTKIDHALDSVAGLNVHHHHQSPASNRVTLGEGADGVLGGLIKSHQRKSPAVAWFVGGGNLGGRRNLVRGQRIKRVGNADGRCRSSLGDHGVAPYAEGSCLQSRLMCSDTPRAREPSTRASPGSRSYNEGGSSGLPSWTVAEVSRLDGLDKCRDVRARSRLVGSPQPPAGTRNAEQLRSFSQVSSNSRSGRDIFMMPAPACSQAWPSC